MKWSKYHDLLHSDHAQKVSKNVRGLILQEITILPCFRSLKAITLHILMSDDGAFVVANAIDEFDALSATTDAF